MFFRHRAAQAEYFDALDRPRAEMVEAYAALASVNRLFWFAEPFQRLMPKYFGRGHCASLSILDLGAGDGLLGNLLADWAKEKRGWNWSLTNLDFNPSALSLNERGRNVAGSVLALPFRDQSFDLVIASQMTHHLSDEEVVQHLREAWRVTRQGIFFSDLHRGPVLYGLLWLMFCVRRFPKHFRADGLLSVKRGFRIGELKSMTHQAGITDARVWLHAGTRVILQAKRN